MKLLQRRKFICGLEESVHRKRLAVEPSPALIPALGPASTFTQSPISPDKIPLSDRKVEPKKNIDFKFFEKERFTMDQRLRTKDENFTAL